MLETLQEAIDRVQALSAYATYKDKLTNTFGLVVECDAPRTTSGTDLLQNIRLVDESYPEGVVLCVFAKQADIMPLAQPGDILELCNVIVQFYQDRPQLFAKMSKPHTFGFLLYRVPGNSLPDGVAPRPVRTFNATVPSQWADEQLPPLLALRIQALGRATAADSASVYLRQIKQLAPPDSDDPEERPACVDMRVKILAIDQRRATEEVILYVWDATDAKPVSASLQMLCSEWKGTQLVAAHPRRHIMPLSAEPPGLQVLHDLPRIGTALPVVMDPAAVPRTGLPEVGDWVKIKVVGVTAVQGQWQVVFGTPSRLTQSQPSQAFQEWYQARLASNATCQWPEDASDIATSCSLQSLPRLTIRQVLLGAAQRQAGPFRVQLRLLGYLPQELQQWCKMHPQPEGAGEPFWEWVAHLWLEDATGELRAMLLCQEGTKLLGIPPQCLRQNPAAVEQLQSRLQYLSEVGDCGGVWMDVALTPLYPALDSSQQQQSSPKQLSTNPQLQQAADSGSGAQHGQVGNAQCDDSQPLLPTQPLLSTQPLLPTQPEGFTDGSQQQASQPAVSPSGVGPSSQAAGGQQPPDTGPAQGQPADAGGAALAPLFVLHDAVFLDGSLQDLGSPQQQQQQQQQEQEQEQQQQDGRLGQAGLPQSGCSEAEHPQQQQTMLAGSPAAAGEESGQLKQQQSQQRRSSSAASPDDSTLSGLGSRKRQHI